MVLSFCFVFNNYDSNNANGHLRYCLPAVANVQIKVSRIFQTSAMN